MRIGLRLLKPETVQWLQRALQRGGFSRAGLARELCERDSWRNPRGKLCAASARKALPRLAQQLGLALPPIQARVPSCRQRAAQGPRPVEFAGSLRQLGGVWLERAQTPAQRRLCADLLRAGHPLGAGRAPGCRVQYLLASRLGPVGVLSFVAAPLRLGPRDRHLGWDDRTRGARIGEVVSNDRFLILPGVRVPQLASHVLAQARRQLGPDWERQHGLEPVLLETCVEAPRPGTSYRAAGWQCVGQTAGQPPGARGPVDRKSVWLRGLRDDWRERLRTPPGRVAGSFPSLELASDASWSEREFARSDLPDGRLRERLVRLGKAWEQCPGQPLPALFPGRAEQQAAYRFLHNGKVAAQDILQPHREALLERCRLHSTVLLVQDTTTLNYTGLGGSTSGLGPLKERSSSSRGLFVHAAVGFTEGGRPLGVSGLETWARPEAEPEQEPEKESRRWFRGLAQGRELGRLSPQTRVVVVGDRESDIYALFQEQAEHAAEAALLVRANAGRQRQVQAECPQLGGTWVRAVEAHLDFVQPVLREREVAIDSQGGKRARAKRTARTEVSIAQVELLPPEEHKGGRPVPVWLVRVLESEPPAGQPALEWLLVSSEGAATAEWAERIVGWYEQRWAIEEYFRLLKTGTRIEDRRLREADALVKCLAFDAITAWQVFSLARHARDAPQTPAEDLLTQDELAMIGAFVERRQLRPAAERGKPFGTDIRSWVVLLARMVGWRPSKRQPYPGNEVLWRAYVRLQTMVLGMQTLRGP
ncbi:MAG: IS4 family transposase [Acidobacteriia bacterium]|nr:IS4 family transposase [Terriglobia bacterium]